MTVYAYIYVEFLNIKKTEDAFFYDINHTELGGDIVNIYCGTLVDNLNHVPIRLLGKRIRKHLRHPGKNR